MFLFCMSLFWLAGMIIITFVVIVPISFFSPATSNFLTTNNVTSGLLFLIAIVIDLIISHLYVKNWGHGKILLNNNEEALLFLKNRLLVTGMKILSENGNRIELTNGSVDNITTTHTLGEIPLFKTHRRNFHGQALKITHLKNKIKIYGKLKDIGYIFPELQPKLLL